MLVDFVYNLPNLLLGIYIVGLAVALAIIGQFLMRLFVTDERREVNNMLILGISQKAGVIFAVVSGFVIVSILGSFDKAAVTVTNEANTAYSLWLNSRAYSEEYEAKVRHAIENYLTVVVQDEWPLQSEGKESPKATSSIETLYRILIDFVPTSAAQRAVHTQNLKHMNALLDARQARLLINSHGLSSIVYWEIIISALAILAFCWFYGSKFPKGHLWLTSILSVGIGLVLFLIVVFDEPFRGKVCISPAPYEKVMQDFARLKIEQPPSPGIGK